MPGLKHLSLGQREAGRLRHFAERVELLGRGLLVHAEQQGTAALDQFLRRGDIGEDHELLDELVRVQPVPEGDGGDAAVFRQDDPPLRQVEVQRLTARPRGAGGGVGGVKRADHAVQQWFRLCIRRPVLRGLHLLIGQRCGGAHEAPHETVADLVALRVEPHADGDAGARNPFVERAEVARQPVRQHGHHTVGEVGGIATLPRLTVQRRAGFHVMRHIRDGYPDDMAAGVAFIAVRLRIDRIVMVAGIGGVDGDEGHVAQIVPAAHGRGFHSIGLGDHAVGEGVADAVLMDRDERNGLRSRGVAQPFDDARLRQTHAGAVAKLFGLHQLAILCALRGGCGHAPVAVGALVDGHDAPALRFLAEDAEDAARVAADLADQAGLVMMVLRPCLHHAGKDAVAGADRGIGLAQHHEDARLRPVALPFQRAGEKVAVAVRLQHLQNGDRGQLLRIAVAAPFPLELAFRLQLFQDAFQLDPLIALHVEGFRDVALGRKAGMCGDPLKDLGFGGQRVHAHALPQAAGPVIRETGGGGSGFAAFSRLPQKPQAK